MSNEKTPKSLVLIVGAGASSEVGLPVGSDLIKQIAASLDFQTDHYGNRNSSNGGSDEIYSSIKQLAQLENTDSSRAPNLYPYLKASKQITDAMPLAPSIDNFINSHQSDTMIAVCGKLAIASCILKAESKSSLYVDPGNIGNKLKAKSSSPSWFNTFFKLLNTDCSFSKISDRLSKISIINFNYDRCIEHYLFHTLQIFYDIDAVQAAQAIAHLDIYHPYGTVGKLPWESQTDGIEFGAKPTAQKLIAVAKQIRTFTEGIDTSTSDILNIRKTVANTNRIAFLGFAFHPLNLNLLFSDTKHSLGSTSLSSIYATAYGISDSDVMHIKNELSKATGAFDSNINLRNGFTCSKLFDEYTRGLALN